MGALGASAATEAASMVAAATASVVVAAAARISQTHPPTLPRDLPSDRHSITPVGTTHSGALQPSYVTPFTVSLSYPDSVSKAVT